MNARDACLDRLALLLDYPDADLPRRLPAAVAAVAAISPATAADLDRFADGIAATSLGELQEQYTETFDLDPECALDVGWHLFGDAHERGAFMAALRADLERAGVPETRDLPDHLGRVLRLVAREEPGADTRLATLIAPVIDTVHTALAARQHPYVHVLAAIRVVLAGIVAESHREVSQQ